MGRARLGFCCALFFVGSLVACGGDDNNSGSHPDASAGGSSGAGGTGGSPGAGGTLATGGGSPGTGGLGLPFDASFNFDALFNFDAGTCADLSACCSRLSGQQQSACQTALASSNGVDAFCSVALTAFHQAGLCL